MRDGVKLIYLGAGSIEVAGPRSGITYRVSAQARYFAAAPEDAPELLADLRFMKEP